MLLDHGIGKNPHNQLIDEESIGEKWWRIPASPELHQIAQ
jgi:hypothetical protein